jgi:hypothetical protein
MSVGWILTAPLFGLRKTVCGSSTTMPGDLSGLSGFLIPPGMVTTQAPIWGPEIVKSPKLGPIKSGEVRVLVRLHRPR